MSSTRLALAYLFVLVFAAPASAAPPPPQCVNPGATNGCFADVQSAINAASRGALIAIAAGTYTGTVTVDRSLILEGADRDTTILDGGAGGSVVTTLPGTTVTLANLTIQNGTGTMAPDPNSPVLGVATHCPKTDQRGDPSSHHCDIGAVESEM